MTNIRSCPAHCLKDSSLSCAAMIFMAISSPHIVVYSYPIIAAVTMDVVFLTMAAALHFPVSTGMLGKCVAIKQCMRMQGLLGLGLVVEINLLSLRLPIDKPVCYLVYMHRSMWSLKCLSSCSVLNILNIVLVTKCQ